MKVKVGMNKENRHNLRILFVCYGNKCRSPMAEGIAKKILKGIAHVESVGIAAWGRKVSKEAINVMKNEFGIDISDHNPTDITDISINNFDYIVTMDFYIDTYIKKYIKQYYQIESNKIISWNIVDPYGGSVDDYKRCVNIIKNQIHDFLKKLEIIS